MTRFHTTVTERASFRTCRRQWYLENIELLEPQGSVAWPLIFGTVCHEALDVYYRNIRSLSDALDAFTDAWKIEDDRLARLYGGLYKMGIEEEWSDYRDKGMQMLKYYDVHDRASGFFDDVEAVGIGFDAWRQNVQVEERHFVEIFDRNKNHIEGTPLLSGRIDLVVNRPNGVWIVDHKTLASAPAWRALEVDDQLTGYCFLWWRMTGDLPRGALYNVLLKDPPKPPRILKSGGLSLDKAQRTTFDLYVQAIDELGLDRRDYEDFLNFLGAKGWNTFFPRDGMNRNKHEIRNFERRLAVEYEDMQRALDDEDARYPNPTQRVCQTCSMVALCQAMEDGSDVQSIREEMYQVKEPRHQVPDDLHEEALS